MSKNLSLCLGPGEPYGRRIREWKTEQRDFGFDSAKRLKLITLCASGRFFAFAQKTPTVSLTWACADRFVLFGGIMGWAISYKTTLWRRRRVMVERAYRVMCLSVAETVT